MNPKCFSFTGALHVFQAALVANVQCIPEIRSCDTPRLVYRLTQVLVQKLSGQVIIETYSLNIRCSRAGYISGLVYFTGVSTYVIDEATISMFIVL